MDALFVSCKNTKMQATIGMGKAIDYFVSNGFVVSVPLIDGQDYDLVVEEPNDHRLLKVQVKTTSVRNKRGAYVVALRTAGGNSKINFIHKTGDKTDYDLLFAVTSNGEKYLIPHALFRESKSCITLGKKYAKHKVKCGG